MNQATEQRRLHDHRYLDRCCELARLAGPATSPNPKVGAVLVYGGRILGEGYHRAAGQAHAEVNCLASVAKRDSTLIPLATLYVSLEPCCFYGRTPACTDLVLSAGIQQVVIGQLDQTPEVSGRGVAILEQKGISVRQYPEHEGCRRLAEERRLFVVEQRPYITLKFAQSADGFLAPAGDGSYWITNRVSRLLTHRMRARTGAILVGAATVIADDPQLTTRHYPGPSPAPVVFDPRGRCTGREQLFQSRDGRPPTLYFGPEQLPSPDERPTPQQLIAPVLHKLHQLGINRLTVEGGAATLQLFLAAGRWDEIWRYTGTEVRFEDGLASPKPRGKAQEQYALGDDLLEVWLR